MTLVFIEKKEYIMRFFLISKKTTLHFKSNFKLLLMKNFNFLVCLLLTGFYSCNQNTDNSRSEKTMTEEETTISETEKTINQLVKEAYVVISFEEGSTIDLGRIRALFTPDATLYNYRGGSLEYVSLVDFIAGFKADIDDGKMIAFNEIELGGETEYFGKIGHRISAYASYFDGSEEVGERGVNSFQVIQVNGKWLINSLIWDVEKKGLDIPERYITE